MSDDGKVQGEGELSAQERWLLEAVPGGPGFDRAFLALNAAACVWLARAVWRKTLE